MSQSLPPIGFWSYARQDDEEKLSRLRSILQRQLQRRYGREQIKIFQDVAAIPPGADWNQQIREALNSSSFLIVVITPNFLESEWCNQEVLLFLEREKALAVQFPELHDTKRIFPIYYIDTTDVEAYDPKVLAELLKRQRTEFRDLLYEDDEQKSVLLRLDGIAESLCTLLRRDQRVVKSRNAPKFGEPSTGQAIALSNAQAETHGKDVLPLHPQPTDPVSAFFPPPEVHARRGELTAAAKATFSSFFQYPRVTKTGKWIVGLGIVIDLLSEPAALLMGSEGYAVFCILTGMTLALIGIAISLSRTPAEHKTRARAWRILLAGILSSACFVVLLFSATSLPSRYGEADVGLIFLLIPVCFLLTAWGFHALSKAPKQDDRAH